MKAIRPAIVFVVLAILIALPTDSCSFGDEPVFVFAKRPDAPVAAYAAGRLGVLMPTFAHSHLVVAWRYLAGKPLSDLEKKAMVAYYSARLKDPALPEQTRHPDPVGEWVAVRNTVIESSGRPSGYRAGDHFSSVINCTGDAFLTAAATLQSRIAEFGIAHPGVRGWVEAQNAVFSNCERRGASPVPAAASLPAKFQFDRNYQIAAAAFYATDFDRAHDLFLAISRDHASPWRRVARLVAARALIRNATVGNFEGFDRVPMSAADQELRAILADDDMRGLHHAASDLEDYVQLHIVPDEQRAKLAQRIATGHLTQHNLADFVALFDKNEKANDEMTDWIRTFSVGGDESQPDAQQDAKAFAHAIARWRETHALPWLVASIANATKTDAHVDDLLDAALKVEPASPAFVMVAYHRARLFLDKGETESATWELDRVLALPDDALGPSTRNLFRELRLPFASSIAEFVLDAARVTAGTWLQEVPEPSYGTLFDDDSSIVFNQALPLASLIEAARAPKVPDPIRRQLVAAAFTRAVALGRTGVAMSLLPDMHRHFDNRLKARLDRFAAAPPSRQRIEALDLLLHVPGLSPFVEPGQGRVAMQTPMTELIHGTGHENWWCAGGISYGEIKYPQYAARYTLRIPKFAQAQAVRDAVAAEEKDLHISGASFMLRGAMTWAKEYPDDPRVPEALSIAVRGTQWSCPDAATAKLASSAFDLLHSHYGATKWAQQTKHWYNGRD